MRPPRVAILALFTAASIFLFCRAVVSLRNTATAVAPESSPQKPRLRSLFAFTAPFTLFPPNAAISLTDDNSTFFPARPAAFGPPLPAKGLSGQLWIGSGFADDNLQDGESQGEFGCSDVPGWDDGPSVLGLATVHQALNTHTKSVVSAGKTTASKRDGADKGPLVDRRPALEPEPQARDRPVDDGPDDYLHENLQRSPKSAQNGAASSSCHAEIQSMQEAAEITGEGALLRRGGCGFLEKVKWAQRRGAVAVVVGDNQKGGPLIQMFARGDTSNITIPAIFTAHTTAQILSSLMQPGSFIEDIIDESGNAALKVQHFDKSRKSRKAKQQQQQHPPAITAPAPLKATAPTNTKRSLPRKKNVQSTAGPAAGVRRRSWFSRLFSWGSSATPVSDKSRPPSSGRLDWVLVDDWSDEKDKIIRTSLEKASKDGTKSSAKPPSEDSFQIGVQDWRDPDLVDTPAQRNAAATQAKDAGKSAGNSNGNSPVAGGAGTVSSPGASAKQTDQKAKDMAGPGPKGGSITPGSGEYAAEPSKDRQAGAAAGKTDAGSGSQGGGGGGLMSKIFGDDDEANFTPTESRPDALSTPPVPQGLPPAEDPHEGLWVTITPTSSASPFFDTLLVLVISPLVTLSVVYALLILRARIRRRRWRAPKSVVEQLPVRTYHTVLSPSPSRSSRLPSPASSSPTTPLLQQRGSSQSSRPRPRSRTTTGVPDSGDLLRVDAALQTTRPSSRAEQHQDTTGSHRHASQWKKYMGRQVECVVCLEEYVDGVSRVMSLPCGHEFHAECM